MSPRKCGFSLVELLVALGITVILVGVMLAVSVQALNAWRRAQDTSTASTQAKLALDLIEQDLQGAVLRRDSGAWLAIDRYDTFGLVQNHGWVKTSDERIKPEGDISRLVSDSSGAPLPFKDTRHGFSGAWFRFITTKIDTNADSASASAPVAVGFQIVRRGFGADPKIDARYALYRSEVAQKSTFTEGYSIAAGGYSSSSVVDGVPGSICSPDISRLLATNVVDFGVRLYARSGSAGTLNPIPSAESSVYRLDPALLPEAADVLVRILTEEGAVLLYSAETGRIIQPATYKTPEAWWWGIVESNSKVFVRRVRLRGTAP